MNVTPKDFTLHSLLNVPTEQFKVPSYQRRYAWKYPQHRALIEDIDMLLPGDGHLFGMLILHTDYYHGGLNSVQVVDGQQRLTTITILLKVLMNKFIELQDDYNAFQVVGQLLYCGDPKKSMIPKLELGELDNPDYINLLKGSLDKIQNKNLADAFTFFTEFIDDAISEEGEGWLQTFLNKLIHTAKIIRLDVMQAPDAYKLFETINNRGLRLSATDILKNFILGHAAKISKEKLSEAREIWSEIIIKLDDIPTDDFFRQYVCGIYTRKISSSKLVEEFKKNYFKRVLEVDKLGEFSYNHGPIETAEFDDEIDDLDDDSKESDLPDYDSNGRIDILEYLGEIRNAANCYSKIWNRKFSDNKINQRISDLQDIKSFPSYIFLMHYLQKELPKKDIYKVLDSIGVTMLRRHVTGQSTAYNDDIFSKLLRVSLDENHVETIKNQLLEDTPSDDEFLDSFPRHEMKQRVIDRARYILTKIELEKRKGTSEISINGAEDVHVEHIIPQTIDTKTSKAEFGDWEKYLGDKAKINHKKFVNRIGNMTLLDSSLNISASNNPFSKKKNSYKASELIITQELAELRDFKFSHLEKRGQELAEIAVKIWKL